MITVKIESGDPYFNTQRSGGYNPCCIGNYPKGKPAAERTGLPGMDVLPNCTAFVVAVFNRLGNYGRCRWLGPWYARDFVKYARMQALQIGTDPKEGAVICWSGGSGGDGHVGIVAEVRDDGSITVIQNGWSAGRTWIAHHSKGDDGQWTAGDDYGWMKGKYVFQGFVYHPDYEGDDEMLTYEQWKEYAKQYEQERADLPASEWALSALDQAKADGVMTGDGNGNLRPQSFMTRQEFAAARLKDKK